MNVDVSGKNLPITDGLVELAERKIARLGRYLGGVERAELRFFEERNPRISDKDVCNLMLRSPRRGVIRARAAAPDPIVALDRAIGKVIHRVEKPKAHC
jgi:ribosomal subunit interface protein